MNRLLVEKINKMERKNQASIVMIAQGDEIAAFWQALGGYDMDFNPIVSAVKRSEYELPVYSQSYAVLYWSLN